MVAVERVFESSVEASARVSQGIVQARGAASGSKVNCTNPLIIQRMVVPCGQCRECRIARSKEWAIRILHEINYFEKKCFITLTYDDDHLPHHGSLDKAEFTLFLKRLRKAVDVKVKYFACGEYGEEFNRPHYHAIILGLDVCDSDDIDNSWGMGLVNIGSVTFGSVRYVADYLQKKWEIVKGHFFDTRELPFQLQSQGLGKRYAVANKNQMIQNKKITLNGEMMPIPRYYRKVLEIGTEVLAEESEISNIEYFAKHLKLCGINHGNRLSDSEKVSLYKSMKEERAQIKINRTGKMSQSHKGF
nr:MAG: replication initiator protein [Microviridae sp.]